MAEQHAVVFFPDLTLNVALVGPFRSHDRALAAMERLNVRLGEERDDLERMNMIPHVVTFMTEDEAVEEFGPEPTDSEADRG